MWTALRRNCALCDVLIAAHALHAVRLLRAPLDSFLPPFLLHIIFFFFGEIACKRFLWMNAGNRQLSFGDSTISPATALFVWNSNSNSFFINEIDMKSVVLNSLGMWNNCVTSCWPKPNRSTKKIICVMCALCVDNNGGRWMESVRATGILHQRFFDVWKVA